MKTISFNLWKPQLLYKWLLTFLIPKPFKEWNKTNVWISKDSNKKITFWTFYSISIRVIKSQLNFPVWGIIVNHVVKIVLLKSNKRKNKDELEKDNIIQKIKKDINSGSILSFKMWGNLFKGPLQSLSQNQIKQNTFSQLNSNTNITLGERNLEGVRVKIPPPPPFLCTLSTIFP